MADVKKLLLMDDDAEILRALAVVLERRRYQVATAREGKEGLAAAQREPPDLVVVDMMMPKKSGFLVLEKLKSQGQASPKFIMITANEGSRHRAYAEMLGVDDYLRKPFAVDVLVDSVQRLCPLANEPQPGEGERRP